MPIIKSTLTSRFFNFDSEYTSNSTTPSINVRIYSCPSCQNDTLIAEGVNGYCENRYVNIYPDIICVRFPDYVPEAIRTDFEEAHRILSLSPKASATLARRCLQGMIRDFWGISKYTLSDEITALKGNVTEAQWKAIDGLRKVGNIGAHMEQDVNLIIDVEPEEAAKLLKLIELLIEKWYVARHDEETLLADIYEMSKEKHTAKST